MEKCENPKEFFNPCYCTECSRSYCPVLQMELSTKKANIFCDKTDRDGKIIRRDIQVLDQPLSQTICEYGLEHHMFQIAALVYGFQDNRTLVPGDQYYINVRVEDARYLEKQAKKEKRKKIREERKMKSIMITNIKWETDGEDVDLPKEIILPRSIKDNDFDAIDDYLSNLTGFLHAAGYTVCEVYRRKNLRYGNLEDFKQLRPGDRIRIGKSIVAVVESVPFYNHDCSEKGWEVETNSGYVSIYNDITLVG